MNVCYKEYEKSSSGVKHGLEETVVEILFWNWTGTVLNVPTP